jgi:hypothetical protein
MEYKLSKGIKKGIVTALTVLVSFLAFAGFADVPIWDLLATYVQPILGAMTVGGAITLLINYLKIKWQS